MFPSPGYRTIFKNISEKYDKDTLQKARSFNKIQYAEDCEASPTPTFQSSIQRSPSSSTELKNKTTKGWKLANNVGFSFWNCESEGHERRSARWHRKRNLVHEQQQRLRTRGLLLNLWLIVQKPFHLQVINGIKLSFWFWKNRLIIITVAVCCGLSFMNWSGSASK